MAARRSVAGYGIGLIDNVAPRRRAYAEWYDWSRREIGGGVERQHAATRGALAALDGGADAAEAAAAARREVGLETASRQDLPSTPTDAPSAALTAEHLPPPPPRPPQPRPRRRPPPAPPRLRAHPPRRHPQARNPHPCPHPRPACRQARRPARGSPPILPIHPCRPQLRATRTPASGDGSPAPSLTRPCSSLGRSSWSSLSSSLWFSVWFRAASSSLTRATSGLCWWSRGS